MDFSSVNSEMIESVDFLRPQVNRNKTSADAFLKLNSGLKSIKGLNDFRSNIAKKTRYTITKKYSLESATSVLEKCNSVKEVNLKSVVQYSSNTSFYKTDQTVKSNLINQVLGIEPKPIIKVTVIPKPERTLVSNVYSKRKPKAKTIDTTLSNYENYTLTKNQLVSKINRNELLKVKTTESVEFTTTKSISQNNVSLKQITSLISVLDSLQMEKKKDKEKKKKKKSKTYTSPKGSIEMIKNPRVDHFHECKCMNSAKSRGLSIENKGTSCVRITGKLGLNESDRYVLKCAATVNDKPVKANIIEDFGSRRYIFNDDVWSKKQCNTHNYCSEQCHIRKFRKQQDSTVQTDVPLDCTIRTGYNDSNIHRVNGPCNSCFAYCCNEDAMICRNQKDCYVEANFPQESRRFPSGTQCVMMPSKVLPSAAAKETQTNFDAESYTKTDIFPNLHTEDKDVQCFCSLREFTEKNDDSCDEYDDDVKSIKRRQSPLVVISVYPTPERCENVKIYAKPQVGNGHNNVASSVPKRDVVYNTSNLERKDPKQSVKQDKNSNRTARSPTSLGKSPMPRSRSPRPLSRSPEIHNKAKSNSNLTDYKFVTPMKRTPSPNRENKSDIRSTNRSLKHNQEKPSWNREKIQIGNKKTIECDKPTTAPNVTKKLLVENYTKHLTSFLDNVNVKNDLKAPQTSSKGNPLTLRNIDTNKDYGVCQVNNITECKVKKSVKCCICPKQCNQADIRMNDCFAKQEQKRFPNVPTRNEKEVKDTFSRIQLRDSLELSHRREDGSSSAKDQPHKNKDIKESNSKDPRKHYIGDDCSMVNPVQRDQEIRALLGIQNRRQQPTASSIILSAGSTHSASDNRCNSTISVLKNITSERTLHKQPLSFCETKELTILKNKTFEPNTNKLLKCLMLAPRERLSAQNFCSQSKISTSQQFSISDNSAGQPGLKYTPEHFPCVSCKKDAICQSIINSNQISRRVSTVILNKLQCTIGTQYDSPSIQQASLNQQVVLKRNIQVFLQLDQFSNQKPIILSQKQYKKVKRTIENTVFNKAKKSTIKSSSISVGEIRKTSKSRPKMFNDKNIQTVDTTNDDAALKDICARNARDNNEHKDYNARLSTSSVEVRYTSVSYTKNVNFSSTNVEAGSAASAMGDKDSFSLHTIYKGRRRSATPNLGTSQYSIDSEGDNKSFESKVKQEFPMRERHTKQKKPFLRRLMSCLVMRSTKFTGLGRLPPTKLNSGRSFDSYHINTSLEGIEMTSSIFDTSASFYSNHSVYPVNSRMKRGFLNSVREFISKGKF